MQPPAAAGSRAALVDELGELNRRISMMAPDISRAKDLQKIVESWALNEPPDKPLSYSGEQYTVQVSPRRMERKVIDVKGIWKALGQTRFLSIVSVPLSKLDLLLSPDELSLFVEEARTGSRRVETVANRKAEVVPIRARRVA